MNDTKIQCENCQFEPVERDYFFLFSPTNIALCVPMLKFKECPVCGEASFSAEACDRLDAAVMENPLAAAQIRTRRNKRSTEKNS